MIRTSTGVSRFPLILVTRFVSTTRRIFAWIGIGIELISSRKMVPWWAISNFPGCPSVLAPVNAPPLVSEQLALRQLQRDRGAIDRHEGAVRPLAIVMD